MEISGIHSLQTIKKVASKEAIQTSRVEDTVTISSEAKKRSEWVEMLKQMPDIRPDKIEAALAGSPVSAADLTAKILKSGF